MYTQQLRSHAGYATLFERPPLKRLFLFLIIFLLPGLYGSAAGNTRTAPPEKIITGKITDETGAPISGASVLLKGSATGVATDTSGNFTIKVPNTGGTLVISHVGYQSQEVVIGDQATIQVTLKSNATEQLTDVVVVGYGTQKKVTLTGAVADVKGAELAKTPTINLTNTLAGRLPGITAINTGGEPGYDGSTIRIRGTNSLGNSSALVVIDGVPDREGGMERLNPNDIESISVLKDASAAIYGSRAANGVILITTKKGKSGKPLLSYTFNQGWAQPTRIPKMSDAVEYGTLRNELAVYENVPVDQWNAAWKALTTTGTYKRTDNGATVSSPVGFFPDDMQQYRDGSDPWGHPNTDWFGATFKKWSPQVRHNIQLTGGSENIRYLGSIGYQNQDAYYKNSATGYKQYDLRLNLDAKLNQYMNLTMGIAAREEYRYFPTETAGEIFRMLMRGKPNEPAVWPNGLPGRDIEYGQNPVVIATNQTGYDRDKRDYIQTNGKLEILIPGVEGLKITGTAAIDKYIKNQKRFETPWYLYSWDRSSYEADGVTPKLTRELRSTFTDPRLNQWTENTLNINLSGLLNYDKKFGEHTVAFLAGVQRETEDYEGFRAFRRYYLSNALDVLDVGGDLEKNNGGGSYRRARLSYFGRVGYNYAEKYLFEFLWRYDGSYIFPPTKRFGFFPGITAGWRVSEEPFFKNNVSFVNSLKLRGSWGQMGAEPYFGGILAEYQFIPAYPFSTYVLNDAVVQTLIENRVANQNFTWEVGNNMNIGLDAAFLNSRLTLELDYFRNLRDKALIAETGLVPQSSGISGKLPPVNKGKMLNRGGEFKIGWRDDIGQVSYSLGLNGGYAKNKVLYSSEPAGVPEWQRTTGKPYGTNGFTIVAYQYDGVFRDQAEINANKVDYSALTSALRPGDMKIKDYNGDNKIDGDDMVALDKTRDPYFTGGFNGSVGYKNLDLSFMFQGAVGGLLFFGTESGDIGNYLQYSFDNRWTIDNPSSVDPRIASRGNTYYTGGAARFNTYFLRSSDYLRLKNVEIGYNLAMPERVRNIISSVRIFANGQNLITWDKMKIWDPESTSGNGQYYPQSRILNIGATVSF
ncbi:TonB-dependent receptor [Niabella pedocola]|uniref:TonB-dependent receptor n=1 Tax=Niabella pedocola TaxID=1752077 RepID=A0ABS8PTX6_9BACT|nr:TonB-dependent receptor [Niabella pedocola]MCD2424527.1 TonB-dependent receptor [Niabella pedocola]